MGAARVGLGLHGGGLPVGTSLKWNFGPSQICNIERVIFGVGFRMCVQTESLRLSVVIDTLLFVLIQWKSALTGPAVCVFSRAPRWFAPRSALPSSSMFGISFPAWLPLIQKLSSSLKILMPFEIQIPGGHQPRPGAAIWGAGLLRLGSAQPVQLHRQQWSC